MSDPSEDRMLEEYLHRKSAISLGYRRIYVEAPPPELDRTVTARARRTLKWLVPGIIATAIALSFVIGINAGVTKYMDILVKVHQEAQRLDAEEKQKKEEERAKAPVPVIIDPNELKQSAPQADRQLSREEWRARIASLKQAGRQTEAQAEQKKFDAAFPQEQSKK